MKGRLPFLDINQERHVPYAGYAGVVELARRVDLALSCPVWEQVRAPAPWDPPAAAEGETVPARRPAAAPALAGVA